MWFIFAIITILAWGGADLFYKLGSGAAEKYTPLRIVAMVGLVMGVHAAAYMLITGVAFDPRCIVTYLPVSFMYMLSMFLGYVGLRYIELSVSSPVSNSSGAVAALLCYLVLDETMTGVQLAAVAVICVGIAAMALFENRAARSSLKPEERRFAVGTVAIIFPILYCVIDGVGTFADAFYLDKLLSETDANLAYELTFFAAGLLAFLYVRVVKRERFIIRNEKSRFAAAALETAGQFFYVRAMAENAIVTAPLISAYSIVSVLLSRIFLKEKLTRAQYVVIAFIMVGIAILGME